MTLIRPASLDAALAVLSGLDPAATTILAGGTDVMVETGAGERVLRDVVAVRRLPELTALTVGPELVRVGAAVTYSAFTGPDGMPYAAAEALFTAATTMGSTQIRGGGTLGGNVGTASAVGDSLCTLLALGAQATVATADGVRVLPVADLLQPGGGSALAATDLLVELAVPVLPGHQRFLKVARRGAVSRSVVSVTAVLTEGADPARIVVGGCAPGPVRVAAAEQLAAEAWTGDGVLDVDAADAVGLAVADALDPPDDIRGSADYRRHVARVLTRRALSARSSRTEALAA